MSIWNILQQQRGGQFGGQNRIFTGQNHGYPQARQSAQVWQNDEEYDEPPNRSVRFRTASAPAISSGNVGASAAEQIATAAAAAATAAVRATAQASAPPPAPPVQRKKGGSNGTAPVGRPKGSTKPSNPLDSKHIPNVSYSVAKKIDKSKDIDSLIQKRNQYSRAINLYKKGYTKSNMFRVLIPPNPGVVVGDSPSIMTPASVGYIVDGQFDGKDMNPLTANNVRRDRAQGGNRPSTGHLPVASGSMSYNAAGGAPQGISSTTRAAPGVLETRLAHDVGAVVIEEGGPTMKDTVVEAAVEKTVGPMDAGTTAGGGTPQVAVPAHSAATLVRGGRMSRAFRQ